MPQNLVSACDEKVIKREFQDEAAVRVAEPAYLRAEFPARRMDQASDGVGGLALAVEMGIDQGLIDGDASQCDSEEQKDPRPEKDGLWQRHTELNMLGRIMHFRCRGAFSQSLSS